MLTKMIAISLHKRKYEKVELQKSFNILCRYENFSVEK